MNPLATDVVLQQDVTLHIHWQPAMAAVLHNYTLDRFNLGYSCKAVANNCKALIRTVAQRTEPPPASTAPGRDQTPAPELNTGVCCNHVCFQTKPWTGKLVSQVVGEQM